MYTRGISNSQIQSWMQCPHRIYLQYVHRCQPAQYNPDEIFFVGRKVHDTTEGYFKNYYKSKASQKYIIYYLYRELQLNWTGVETTKTKEQLVEDYKRIYQNLIGISEIEAWRTNQNPQKPHIEYEKDVKTAKVYIKPDLFDEVIDYLADWKTGKAAKISRSEIIQACVYKIGIDANFKKDLKEAHFIFPALPADYRDNVVKYNDVEVQKILEEVQQTILDIKKAFKYNKFPKRPRTPNLCNYCDLKAYCKGLRV